MTEREGAIITAYTGKLCCAFPVFHEYAEEIVGHDIMTHMFGIDAFAEKIKEASESDFLELLKNQKEKAK